MNRQQDSAGAPHRRLMGHSWAEGAEKVEGHSAGRTARASDLREDRVPIWAWPVAGFKAMLWGLGLGRWL